MLAFYDSVVSGADPLGSVPDVSVVFVGTSAVSGKNAMLVVGSCHIDTIDGVWCFEVFVDDPVLYEVG
jgi:hypothetical protein